MPPVTPILGPGLLRLRRRTLLRTALPKLAERRVKKCHSGSGRVSPGA